MNTRPLDSFESALLAELRQHVAEQPAAGAEPRGPSAAATPAPPRPSVAAGVAASVVAVFGLGSGGGSPAYAVDQDSDGDVIVTVHRLDDAAGLEKALRAKGDRRRRQLRRRRPVRSSLHRQRSPT